MSIHIQEEQRIVFFNVSSDISCGEKYSAENNNANSKLFIEIRIVRVSKI